MRTLQTFTNRNHKSLYRKSIKSIFKIRIFRSTIIIISLMCLILTSGCVISQQQSENYALMKGVTANDPVIIDGDLNTVGESQTKKASGSLDIDAKLTSESIVFLPEKRKIFQVKIHSSNIQDFQLMALNTLGEWDQIHEQRSTDSKIIDIRLRRPVTTTGIKVIVRKTSDDAARKRQNLRVGRENEETPDGKIRRGRFVYKVSGPLTAPGKIAEIELFGYVDKTP
ncbi:hypothetical protein C6497_16715 [Candidatus Poribacteria bacterium]|nr:MAG: hypothetical protein C6497_16715 [Candidatus Poribacteria bacterium]